MGMNQAQVFSTIATPLDRGRIVRFAISTVEDRHGTLLDPLGLDLTWYRANPVVIWSHRGSNKDMPEPRPEDLIGRTVEIKVAPDLIEFDVEFATMEINPVADRVYRMVLAGYLNAVSLGFVPCETQNQDGIKVIKQSELHELSLVLVGSNPSALAVRSYITTGENQMDKDALIKLLGLDETADREAAERACMAYLVKTEDAPEQRAAVVKALDEVWPESDKGEDLSKDKPEGEARAADKGEDEGKDKGDAETRSLATANKYLARALADLKAEQGQAVVKAVSETERKAVAVRTVEGLIRSGRIPVSAKDEAVKDELDGVLAGALRYLPEGACTLAKGAQRSGAGARVQTRSAPPVVAVDEAVDEKGVDADADRILKGAAARNKSLYTPGA